MPFLERVFVGLKASFFVYKENKDEDSLLESLNRLSPNDFKTLNTLMRITCENGEMKNVTKYKRLNKVISEFKTKDYRILSGKISGWNPPAYILLSRFKKCPNKEYKPKIISAENLMTNILSLINSKKISILK